MFLSDNTAENRRHRRDFDCQENKTYPMYSVICWMSAQNKPTKRVTSFEWFLIFFCAELRSVLRTRMSASRAAIWQIKQAQFRYINRLKLAEKDVEYDTCFLLSTSSMMFLFFSSTPPSSSRSWPFDFSLSRILNKITHEWKPAIAKSCWKPIVAHIN